MTGTRTSLPPDLTGSIDRLREIPEEQRSFDVGERRAAAEFGVDELLARELIEAGVPYCDSPDERLFAEVDLHFIGIRLGCAAPYVAALGQWATVLQSLTAGGKTTLTVRYVAQAPPGTDVEVLLPPGRRTSTTLGADRTAARFETSLRTVWPEVDPLLHDILEELASLELALIPQQLVCDTEFLRRTRLASCASASQLLVEECGRRGIEARRAFGLMLARPFATTHNWAEVRVGDTWVPLDPLLLGTLERWADADPRAWPPTRSPGGMLLRVAAEPTAIVTADGEPLPVSFLTSLLS